MYYKNLIAKKLLLVLFTLVIISSGVAFAHSGRTDGAGGHKDNKNVSGLGSYHYHHGYGPHLHPNGVCPYDTSTNNSVSDPEPDPVVVSTPNPTIKPTHIITVTPTQIITVAPTQEVVTPVVTIAPTLEVATLDASYDILASDIPQITPTKTLSPIQSVIMVLAFLIFFVSIVCLIVGIVFVIIKKPAKLFFIVAAIGASIFIVVIIALSK